MENVSKKLTVCRYKGLLATPSAVEVFGDKTVVHSRKLSLASIKPHALDTTNAFIAAYVYCQSNCDTNNEREYVAAVDLCNGDSILLEGASPDLVHFIGEFETARHEPVLSQVAAMIYLGRRKDGLWTTSQPQAIQRSPAILDCKGTA